MVGQDFLVAESISLTAKSSGLPAHHQPLHFHEQGCCIRTIREEAERLQAYRLRYRIFCKGLGWVGDNPQELDRDEYDDRAVLLGIFQENCSTQLVATLRLLLADGPFMVEREFSALLSPETCLRKERDTTEITRFAIDPQVGTERAQRLCALLYKAWYQWSLQNDVRYVYLEVETRYWRKLRMIGFPCEPLGPSRRLPPGEADSVALILDWETFREVNRAKRPDWLAWMSTARSRPAAWPRRPLGRASRLAAYRGCSTRETAPSVR